MVFVGGITLSQKTPLCVGGSGSGSVSGSGSGSVSLAASIRVAERGWQGGLGSLFRFWTRFQCARHDRAVPPADLCRRF
jgi:hypothetical protein